MFRSVTKTTRATTERDSESTHSDIYTCKTEGSVVVSEFAVVVLVRAYSLVVVAHGGRLVAHIYSTQ